MSTGTAATPGASPTQPEVGNPGVDPAEVRLSELLLTFLRLGTVTFGGGLQGWIFREVVDKKKWLSTGDLLSGATLAQVLPGANPVNLALYVGLRLRGAVGALVAVIAITLPAFVILLTLGALYRSYGNGSMSHAVLKGLAAAGVGMTAAMGVRFARHLSDNIAALLVALAVFTVVGLLHGSTALTLAVLAPLSIGWAALQERRRGS